MKKPIVTAALASAAVMLTNAAAAQLVIREIEPQSPYPPGFDTPQMAPEMSRGNEVRQDRLLQQGRMPRRDGNGRGHPVDQGVYEGPVDGPQPQELAPGLADHPQSLGDRRQVGGVQRIPC